MQIVYEDDNVIVVLKEAGEPAQTSKGSVLDLVSKIKVHLVKDMGVKGDPYVGIVHRLDQPVRGLLVFAKDKDSAAVLSRQVQTDLMNKIYTAQVEGALPEKSTATLTDYMYKDAKESKAVIVDSQNGMNGKDVKKAELSYEVLSYDKETDTSNLRIYLKTGRFHQIRAQLSNTGHPIIGDVKYGAKKTSGKGIGLTSSELDFIHPKTKKKMHFEIPEDRKAE